MHRYVFKDYKTVKLLCDYKGNSPQECHKYLNVFLAPLTFYYLSHNSGNRLSSTRTL